MTMVYFDKHTTNLLEKIAFGIEEQNNRLKNIETKLDNLSKELDKISSNMGYIEMMMENSENI